MNLPAVIEHDTVAEANTRVVLLKTLIGKFHWSKRGASAVAQTMIPEAEWGTEWKQRRHDWNSEHASIDLSAFLHYCMNNPLQRLGAELMAAKDSDEAENLASQFWSTVTR
jgi:hypothetical protein